MLNDKHTIFGINGCIAVLSSRKYKISEIIIQNGSKAESDGQVTHLLGHYGGHVKFYLELSSNRSIKNTERKELLCILMHR